MPGWARSAAARAAAPTPPAPATARRRRQRLVSARLPRDPAEQQAAPRLDPEGGEAPRRERRHVGGSRGQHEPERPGRGRAVRANEAAVVAPRLRARDPLLEDRRQQGIPDRDRPPEPDRAVPARELGDERMEPRVEAGRVVVEAEERGQPFEEVTRRRDPTHERGQPRRRPESRSPPARRGSRRRESPLPRRRASSGRRSRARAARGTRGGPPDDRARPPSRPRFRGAPRHRSSACNSAATHEPGASSPAPNANPG